MSKREALNSKFSLKVLSLLLTTVGIMILVWYLRFVETGLSVWLLYFGAVLLSAGNMLSFVTIQGKSKNLHFLFVLFLTTVFLTSMYTIRFGSLQGSDILYEYSSAQATLQQGWSIYRSLYENYFSAVSISLFPSILSEISSLDLSLIFEIILPLIAALLPIVIFLTVKDVFKNTRIAGLSALLFSQLYFNFNLLPSVMRQYLAEITLVLSILVIVRIYQKKSSKIWSWVLLLMISLFGLATFHYTVAYWSIAIFGAIFIMESLTPFLPQKILKIFKLSSLTKQRKIFKTEYMLLFFIFVALWTLITNFMPLLTDINSQLYLLSGGTTPGGSDQGHYQVGWLSGSQVGLFTTVWFILVAGLDALGFIYFLFMVPKRKIHVPWTIAALVMFGAIALWVAPSFSGGLIYLDRVYLLGSVFFTAFAAGLLLKLDSKLKVLVAVFLLINLPVNMLILPNERYVLYHKESDVAPTNQLITNIIRQPSMILAGWLVNHSSSTTLVYADYVTGARSLYSIGIGSDYFRVIPLTSVSPDDFVLTDKNATVLLFLHYLNLEHGLWQSGEQTHTVIDVQETLNNTPIPYNNGQALLASLALEEY